MDRRHLLIAGAAALAGCATAAAPPMAASPPVAAPAAASFDLLEALYALRTGPDGLTISVASNGCTTKADFAVLVDKTPAGPRVAFGRRRLDTCKSFAMGKTDLAFTWAELGLDGRGPAFLLNPITAWTGPGR